MMRKVDGARWAFVVLMVSMFAASGADKVITDEKRGFQITIPEAWQVNSNCFYLPNKNSEYPYAWVTFVLKSLNDGTTLAAFVEQSECKGEKVEGKLGDFNAIKITKVGRSQPLKYFILSGRRGCIINVHVNEADYDLYAKDIDAIVKSFKLIEAK